MPWPRPRQGGGGLAKAAETGGAGAALIVTVNVYSNGKTFARDVTDAYIRLFAPSGGNQELMRYPLDNGSVHTRGLVFAGLMSRGAGKPWVMKALGKECAGQKGVSPETITVAKAAVAEMSAQLA